MESFNQLLSGTPDEQETQEKLEPKPQPSLSETLADQSSLQDQAPSVISGTDAGASTSMRSAMYDLNEMFGARLVEFKPRLKEFYSSCLQETGLRTLTKGERAQLIEKIVRLCRLQTKQMNLAEIEESFERFLTSSETHLETFEDHIAALVKWYSTVEIPLHHYYKKATVPPLQPKQNPGHFFEQEVVASVQVFQLLIEHAPENSAQAKKIIACLKKGLNRYQEDVQTTFKLDPNRSEPTQAEIDGLNQIYVWYANQHQTHGKNPTFEAMNRDQNVLDSGTFVQFCRDFGILGDQKRYQRRQLTKAECLSTFKRHAEFQRDMTYDQFIASLDSLGILYFDEKYDDFNPSLNASNRPVEEKRVLLYQLMQCGNKAVIHSRRKQFGRSFTTDIGSESRISRNDTGAKFKFKAKTKQASQSPRVSEYRKTRLALIEEEKQKKQKQRYDDAVNARKRLRNKLRQLPAISSVKNSDRHSATESALMSPAVDSLKLRDISGVGYKRLQIEERELRDLIESGESDDNDVIHRYNNMSGFR